MKKIILLLPLFFWLTLFLIEIISFFFQYPKPMYFRAWEYVLNQGKDSYYVPFQPRITYNGPMSGDLLLSYDMLPKKSEIRNQFFQVDEYGFRNDIGTYRKNPEAVLIGTSFVGGAQETQENLVSSLLTKKYNIPTYNYATLPLQHFWEDDRFIKTAPKYVIVLMNESEALQNTWVEVLKPSTAMHTIRNWSSHAQWDKKENGFDYSFTNISTILKRFSIVKYLLKEGYLAILNDLFSRRFIAANLLRLNVYDSDTDMLLPNSDIYDPMLDKKSVKDTVKTLIVTRDVLKTRGITLIVAVMPSKTTLYSKQFRNLNPEKESLSLLENELDQNNIENVKLFALMKQQKDLVYYKEDGHWNFIANRIIASELAKKIGHLK